MLRIEKNFITRPFTLWCHWFALIMRHQHYSPTFRSSFSFVAYPQCTSKIACVTFFNTESRSLIQNARRETRAADDSDTFSFNSAEMGLDHVKYEDEIRILLWLYSIPKNPSCWIVMLLSLTHTHTSHQCNIPKTWLVPHWLLFDIPFFLSWISAPFEV